MLRVQTLALATVSVALIAVTPLIAQADARELPPSGQVTFDVFRKEGFLGTHTITFDNQGDEFSATVDVELKVRIGFITFFYYKHDATEVWRDGAFSALTATTRKDRKDLYVNAAVDEAGVLVDAVEKQGYVDGRALPTTWWNEDALTRDVLVNAELGSALPVEILEIEETTYEVAGQMVPATRYRIAGTLDLDLFYDEAGRWIGCEFLARGAVVRYVMTSPYTPA